MSDNSDWYTQRGDALPPPQPDEDIEDDSFLGYYPLDADGRIYAAVFESPSVEIRPDYASRLISPEAFLGNVEDIQSLTVSELALVIPYDQAASVAIRATAFASLTQALGYIQGYEQYLGLLFIGDFWYVAQTY